ncbi:MAG TPA: ABC transporter ATP-binding protein [Bryobacteraceae bacterium]
MSAPVRMESLTKKYGGTEALHGLTLEAPEGSVFALVGPSGAGKSTAIKALMNILRPTAGRAEVLGVDSRRLGARELAQIGYVSENQELPEWMRVGYFLDYCKKFYPGWGDEDAAALVRLYELPSDRRLRQLSRGMRVKAALASALAYRPRLIVLDEPFSGLDVLVREQLIESILERTPEATVLLASHDLAEIESFASHIAYLEDGRLKFTEEMGALSERFREVEVTLESGAEIPRKLPATWLNPKRASVIARFTDTRYEDERTHAEIRRRFQTVRDVSVRRMTLRGIFVALARTARRES